MAPGIAAVLAGLGLSMFPVARRGPWSMVFAFAGAGAALTGFAAGPPFALALVLLAGASLCLVSIQVIAGTMVQQAIPDALRGRISAVGSAGQNGVAGLAATATAGLAAALSPGRAVTGLAMVTAGAGVLLALLIAREPRSEAAARRPQPASAGREP
jgi:hypothetical protein